MSERATLTQGVQLGVETTPGTSVAATKKLQSTSIETTIKAEINSFRPMGTKFSTTEILGKEWAEFKISGAASYQDSAYLLSSCLAYSAPTQIATSGAYTWTYAPSSTAVDTVKTYTVEQGSSVRAHKLTNALVTEVEYDFTRKGVEVKGSGLGQAISDGITMTASPTTVAEKPILPTDIDVYLDSTSGGLGTTKLTRAVKCNIKVSDRFGPVWVLNSANTSFVATIESEPKAEVKLMVEADSGGMGILTNMRNTSTQFLRVSATSQDNAGSTGTNKYSLQWDAAVKVKDVSDFSDEDGVYAIEWTFDMVHDATWGKAFTVSNVNSLSAL